MKVTVTLFKRKLPNGESNYVAEVTGMETSPGKMTCEMYNANIFEHMDSHDFQVEDDFPTLYGRTEELDGRTMVEIGEVRASIKLFLEEVLKYRSGGLRKDVRSEAKKIFGEELMGDW